MDDILIEVNEVSKKFCKDFKKSLRYGISDIFAELFNNRTSAKLRKKEFWAVDNISFNLKRGECIGLIGHNGAGKSTLLKMLNGLIKPDTGQIKLKGRIGALIELGAGFNPILTGRENVYNNATVLGFKKKEIDKKFDSIVEFAEIGEFIDSPVQNYSSGMRVRLGFAIAAQMEPDILLIDEVLAVGDIGFKIKCYNRITELVNKSAVIFVTHSMAQIARICTSVILMDRGKITYNSDNIGKGIEKYYEKFKVSESNNVISESIIINKLTLNGIAINKNSLIDLSYNGPLNLNFEIMVKEPIPNIWISIVFFDMEQRNVAFGKSDNISLQSNTDNSIAVGFQNIPFTNGSYTITITIAQEDEIGDRRIILARYQNYAKILMSNAPHIAHTPVQFPVTTIKI